jgi:transcriptional regulator with XRE-family HTH domain
MEMLNPESLPGIASAQTELGLTLSQIAEAVQTDEARLHQWRSGATPSPIFLSRLKALDDLAAEMKITFRNREAAQEWLRRPLLSLEGQCPFNLILDGEAEVLTGMLYELNSGMSS